MQIFKIMVQCKILYSNTILFSGSMFIATLMNSLSKNGTRASKPQANVDLFARKQSYLWSALICIEEKANYPLNFHFDHL